MSENENKRITDAFAKIELAINEINDLFPSIPKTQIKIRTTTDPLKILKRMHGIIKNYNEENAERKLKNLVALLIVTLPKKERAGK